MMKKLLSIFLLLSVLSFGQDKKISQLTPLPSVLGSELLPVARGGANYYMTTSQLPTYLTGAFVPLAGTSNLYPLTGTIEYRGPVAGTALVDTTNTMWIGAGNRKDLFTNATTYGRIAFIVGGGASIASRSASGQSSVSILPNLLTMSALNSSSVTTNIALTAQTASVTSTYSLFPGIQYSVDLSSKFRKYSLVDSNWVANNFSPFVSGGYLPLSGGTMTGVIFSDVGMFSTDRNFSVVTQSGAAVLQGSDGINTINQVVTEANDIYLTSSDGLNNSSTYSINPSQQYLITSDATNNSRFDLTPTTQKIKSNYASFHGLQYSASTATNVAANPTDSSLMHKAFNDSHYAPISYSTAVTHANAPLSITTNTISISQSNTSTNGYLSSTDWNTFNNKQSALTFNSPISNSSNTVSISDASASVSGVVNTTAQSFAGIKTFANDVILNGNVTYTPTVNSSLTGANARIPSHASANLVFTNASLTSIASANDGGVSGGHTIMLTNETGATISIVNSYTAASAGEAILTGTGTNLNLPNHGVCWLNYDGTNSSWGVMAGGLLSNFAVSTATTSINGTTVTLGTTNTVTAAAGTLTGATLASGVTASSLTSFGTSPTFTTPILGTPTSGDLSNCTNYPSSSDLGISRASGDYGPHHMIDGPATSVVGWGAGTYVFQRLTPSQNFTVTSLSIVVTTSVTASSCNLGIYSDSVITGSHVPGHLIVQTGTLSCAVTGKVEGAITATPINALTKYWVCTQTSSNTLAFAGCSNTSHNIYSSADSKMHANIWQTGSIGNLPSHVSTTLNYVDSNAGFNYTMLLKAQ